MEPLTTEERFVLLSLYLSYPSGEVIAPSRVFKGLEEKRVLYMGELTEVGCQVARLLYEGGLFDERVH